MQSQASSTKSDPRPVEMSLEEKQRILEDEILIGEKIQAEMVRMLGCPILEEQKNKAFEDDEAHRKSIELAIEGSQQFRERMEFSMQKIETGMEHVRTEMAELRKAIDAHERQDLTSENDALCPTPGVGSWWNPCPALHKWVARGLLGALLIIILIVLLLRK